MTTATIVRQARTAAGHSQQSLATACGLSKRTIQNIEAGGSPTSETVMALRSVLGIDIPLRSASDQTKSTSEVGLIAMAASVHEQGDVVLLDVYEIQLAQVMTTLIVAILLLGIGPILTFQTGWIGSLPTKVGFLTVLIMLFVAVWCVGNRMIARKESRGFGRIKPDADIVVSAIERGEIEKISGNFVRVARRVLGNARVDAAFVALPKSCTVVY